MQAVGAVFAAFRYCSLPTATLEALPDLSNTHVIDSKWEQSPDIIEDPVSYPIVTALLGAPKDARGARRHGLRRELRLGYLPRRHESLLGADEHAGTPFWRAVQAAPRPEQVSLLLTFEAGSKLDCQVVNDLNLVATGFHISAAQ